MYNEAAQGVGLTRVTSPDAIWAGREGRELTAAVTRIGTTPRRDRAGIAWLAILTLLINALFPAALSAAAGQNSHDGSAWCGTAPNHPRPDHGAPLAPCDHCCMCSAPANGLTPPIRAEAAAPAPIAVAPYRAAESFASPWRSSYRPAQPRGPPGAAWT